MDLRFSAALEALRDDVRAFVRANLSPELRQKVRDVPGVSAVPSVEIEIDAATRQGRITLEGIETEEGLVTVQVLTPNP